MLNIKDKLKNLLNKNKEYEEIFSTSEKKRNLENTNPLDISDEGRDIILSDYKTIHFKMKHTEHKYDDSVDYRVTANEISKSVFKLLFTGIFLFILFFVSAAVEVIYRFYPTVFTYFSHIDKNYLYLYFQGAINIIFLIYAVIFFIKELKSYKNFLFSNGTVSVLIGALSLLQCLSLLITPSNLSSENFNTYVAIWGLYIIMQHFSCLFVRRRIKRNINFITRKKTKFVSGMYEKGSLDSNGAHKVAYRKSKDDINDLLDAAFMTTSLSKITSLFNLLAIFISIVVSVFCIINSRSQTYIFSALTVTLLMISPIPFLSCINFHINGICKKALKKGAMIASLYTSQCFSKTDAIVVDASDLYPTENVVLVSIKTFRGQRIDEAILRAAAVICDIGGPISKVFNKIIMGKKSMLSKPTEVIYEDEMGVVGCIDSQRVLLGNRDLLKKYKVDPPSRDYERKYIDPGMEHIYLAMDRELVAMFILNYLPNKNLKRCLNKLEKNGISIFVKTTDCNITNSKVSRDFNISKDGIKILKSKTSEQINKIENIKNNNPPALLCTFKRFSSFVWGICLAKKMFVRKNIAMLIMILAVILGCVFSLSLSLSGGINTIRPIELAIYYAFWILISILIPKFSL